MYCKRVIAEKELPLSQFPIYTFVSIDRTFKEQPFCCPSRGADVGSDCTLGNLLSSPLAVLVIAVTVGRPA